MVREPGLVTEMYHALQNHTASSRIAELCLSTLATLASTRSNNNNTVNHFGLDGLTEKVKNLAERLCVSLM